MPTNNQHKAFHARCQKCGNVIYLEVLGKPIIVLGSEVARATAGAMSMHQYFGLEDILKLIDISRKVVSWKPGNSGTHKRYRVAGKECEANNIEVNK
jgi:hypothetical protein